MYCNKCGAQNPDNAGFCEKCGAPLENQPARQTVTAARTAEKNTQVGMIAVGAAALVIVILLISLFSGRGYKATVKKLLDASLNFNGSAYTAVIPKNVLETVADSADMSVKEYKKAMNDMLEGGKELVEDLTGITKFSYSVKFVDVEKIKGDELEEIQELYEDYYDTKVKAARTVTVDITIKADGEKHTVRDFEIPLIKVGGSWYVDIVELSSLYASLANNLLKMF